jgi:hypothetical protein
MKRGQAGDESIWFSNTQRMFKAYLKAQEMLSHGASSDELLVAWCNRHGVVRVEIELKRRLLLDLGLSDFGSVSDARLVEVFRDQTELLRRVDRSDAPDFLAGIPSRYRMTAAAWMSGQDLRGLLSNGTLYRHARALRDCGIDILGSRNVEVLPLRVRVVELRPLAVPDWYQLERAA